MQHYIHAVWAVKRRKRVLYENVRIKLYEHIIENARSKSIFVDRINGSYDHIHCLFTLAPGLSIAKALMLIKGESAYWANKERIFPSKLQWAHKYYAVKIDNTSLEAVRRYIDDQKNHHQVISYHDRINQFLKDVDLQA